MNLNQLGMDDVLIKVIDPVKKDVIGIFNSYSDAGAKLFMSPKVLKAAACSKTRRFCLVLNKEIAVRVISKTKVGAI